jgi:hypothetical protein
MLLCCSGLQPCIHHHSGIACRWVRRHDLLLFASFHPCKVLHLVSGCCVCLRSWMRPTLTLQSAC